MSWLEPEPLLLLRRPSFIYSSQGEQSYCQASRVSPVLTFFRRMNLHEDVEGNLVTATFELPGLSKDKVNIDVHNNHLTISGEVAESSELSQGGYKIKERRSGKFSRTLQLPEGTQVNTLV
jgi:HSP20 family protein